MATQDAEPKELRAQVSRGASTLGTAKGPVRGMDAMSNAVWCMVALKQGRAKERDGRGGCSVRAASVRGLCVLARWRTFAVLPANVVHSELNHPGLACNVHWTQVCTVLSRPRRRSAAGPLGAAAKLVAAALNV